MYAPIESVLVIGVVAIIALCLGAYAASQTKTFRVNLRLYRKRSKMQRELDHYFENMRWYGFKDEDIIEMIWEHHDSFESLKSANVKAKKERTGKI